MSCARRRSCDAANRRRVSVRIMVHVPATVAAAAVVEGAEVERVGCACEMAARSVMEALVSALAAKAGRPIQGIAAPPKSRGPGRHRTRGARVQAALQARGRPRRFLAAILERMARTPMCAAAPADPLVRAVGGPPRPRGQPLQFTLTRLAQLRSLSKALPWHRDQARAAVELAAARTTPREAAGVAPQQVSHLVSVRGQSEATRPCQ